MKEQELKSELSKLGYIVEYIPAIGKFEVNRTKLKVDSHDNHGQGYRYYSWLPMTYIIWCIENEKRDLGEHLRHTNKFYAHGMKEGIKLM